MSAIDLLDIAPSGGESVAVPGGELTVAGLDVRALIRLLARFPELRSLLAGGDTALETLAAVAPQAVAAAIAAAAGHPGDDAREAAAARLPLGTQADLLAAIMRQTMPRGLRPFVAALGALAADPMATDAASAPSPPQSTN
jgi:hypothetical protein